MLPCLRGVVVRHQYLRAVYDGQQSYDWLNLMNHTYLKTTVKKT